MSDQPALCDDTGAVPYELWRIQPDGCPWCGADDGCYCEPLRQECGCPVGAAHTCNPPF